MSILLMSFFRKLTVLKGLTIKTNATNFLIVTMFLIFSALVLSNQEISDWRSIYQYENGRRDFIDINSLTSRRCGFSLAFWCRRFSELHDYAVMKLNNEMSAKYIVDYHCKRKMWRLIRVESYRENMGRGELLLDMAGDEIWKKIIVDSVEDQKYKYVCRGY